MNPPDNGYHNIGIVHPAGKEDLDDCVPCHGINADGNGRAARLHNPRPANLRASDKNDACIRLIVMRGGEAIGRSAKMPPWGEELTDEQINDIVAFVRSVNVHPSVADQTAARRP